MTHQWKQIIEAGQDVADRIAALKAETVKQSVRRPDCYDSETLCAHQRRVAAMGYVEAEIVEGINGGYCLHYASGLQNWGLIFRSRETDGTLEGAIAKAKQWQAADPAHRWVTRTVAA